MCKDSRRKAWYLRENMKKSFSVKTNIARVVAGREMEGAFK